MTPTEQDKEQREIALLVDKLYRMAISGVTKDQADKLITADRKRVALDTELQLLTYLLDERTENMFMQNPDTGEMTGNGWLCNTSLYAVSANRIETERRKRIAELKAQQEEI